MVLKTDSPNAHGQEGEGVGGRNQQEAVKKARQEMEAKHRS